MATKKQRKRYRLHQIIKGEFNYDAQGHTVFVPYDFNKTNYTLKVQRALGELIKLNYSIQTEIV